jgi:hypothetical protein
MKLEGMKLKPSETEAVNCLLYSLRLGKVCKQSG